jgi:hypothetical protein
LEAAQLPSHPKWASKKSWNIIGGYFAELSIPGNCFAFLQEKSFFNAIL